MERAVGSLLSLRHGAHALEGDGMRVWFVTWRTLMLKEAVLLVVWCVGMAAVGAGIWVNRPGQHGGLATVVTAAGIGALAGAGLVVLYSALAVAKRQRYRVEGKVAELYEPVMRTQERIAATVVDQTGAEHNFYTRGAAARTAQRILSTVPPYASPRAPRWLLNYANPLRVASLPAIGGYFVRYDQEQ